MLRNKDFWVGLLVGVVLYYVYTTHIRKGPAQ